MLPSIGARTVEAGRTVPCAPRSAPAYSGWRRPGDRPPHDPRTIAFHKDGMMAGTFDIIGARPDGRTLLQSLDAHPPDLLILEITLPGVSGLDLARQIAARPVHPGIVMLTVHSDPDYVRAAFAAGASAYVVKSRLATDLHPALRAALVGSTFTSPLPPEEEKAA